MILCFNLNLYNCGSDLTIVSIHCTYFKPSKCLFLATVCSDLSNTIQTEPVLNENTLAKNFYGLRLSIKFLLRKDSYYWTHPGLKNRPQTQTTIYQKIAPCKSKKENGFKVTCQKFPCDGSTYIISSLTLMFPLVHNVVFGVNPISINNTPLDLITVMVKGKCFVAIFGSVTWGNGEICSFQSNS